MHSFCGLCSVYHNVPSYVSSAVVYSLLLLSVHLSCSAFVFILSFLCLVYLLAFLLKTLGPFANYLAFYTAIMPIILTMLP